MNKRRMWGSRSNHANGGCLQENRQSDPLQYQEAKWGINKQSKKKSASVPCVELESDSFSSQ